MNRIIRFTKLFFHYIGHVWYVSKFEHSFYIVHGTNSLQKHNGAVSKVNKVIKKSKKK